MARKSRFNGGSKTRKPRKPSSGKRSGKGNAWVRYTGGKGGAGYKPSSAPLPD